MVSLSTGSFKLNLEVILVSDLKQHEQTLPETIKKLVLEFRNWAKLNNPVIVDENNIVLDGNHRARVFQDLNYRYIAVCKIDYFNDDVLLRYWFRHVKGVNAQDAVYLVSLMEDEGASIQEIANGPILREKLFSNPLSMGVHYNDSWRMITYPTTVIADAVAAYDKVKEIEQKIQERGHTYEYTPCQYLQEPKFLSTMHRDDFILLTPHITKQMVVDASNEGKIFAPKSTRHVIPARPLNVNIPITWLNENVDIQAINNKFNNFLEGKEVRKFPPGQVIDGRFYGEEIFVFFDKNK